MPAEAREITYQKWMVETCALEKELCERMVARKELESVLAYQRPLTHLQVKCM